MIILEDGTYDLSPEEWAYERICMAGLAIADLNEIIECRYSGGKSFVPTKTNVLEAFGLLASGLEWTEEQIAPFRAEFERGLGNDMKSRAVIMRAALDRLTTEIGYAPQHPMSGTVVATFSLTGDNDQ